MSTLVSTVQRPLSTVLLVVAASLLLVAATYFVLVWIHRSSADEILTVKKEDHEKVNTVFTIIGVVSLFVLLACSYSLYRVEYTAVTEVAEAKVEKAKIKKVEKIKEVKVEKKALSIQCSNDEYFSTHANECTINYFSRVASKKWQTVLQAAAELHENSEQEKVPRQQHNIMAAIEPSHAEVAVSGRSKTDTLLGAQTFAIKASASHQIFMFRQDCAGVSGDQNLLVIADGVSAADQSDITANIVVKMVLMLYEMDPGRFDLIGRADSLLRMLFKFVNDIPLIRGSTTLVIAQRHPASSTIKVWGYGDSAAMLVGPDENVKLLTKDHEVYRNLPYQISHNDLANEMKVEEIFLYSGKYEAGDTLMVMSDGIADNIWARSLARMKNAHQIVSFALKVANDPNILVPYNRVELKERGGKPDDMSLIVVQL